MGSDHRWQCLSRLSLVKVVRAYETVCLDEMSFTFGFRSVPGTSVEGVGEGPPCSGDYVVEPEGVSW